MPRLKESTEYLRRNYTADEIIRMGSELAGAHNRLADIKKEKEVVTAQFKERQAQIEQTVEQLSRNICTQFEMANVRCRLAYGDPNPMEVTYYRLDNGEKVKMRAMLPDEMQDELPLEAPATAADEAQSIENSQAAADEFFKPGRPTEFPTAESAAPVPEDDPLELCQNCEKKFPSSTLRTTDDDVSLCPECWQACIEEGENNKPSVEDLDAHAAEEEVQEAIADAPPAEMPESIASQNTGGRGKKKKNGPAELKKFHEEQVAQETSESQKSAEPDDDIPW